MGKTLSTLSKQDTPQFAPSSTLGYSPYEFVKTPNNHFRIFKRAKTCCPTAAPCVKPTSQAGR
jgi:hypothetical protein